MLLDKQTVTIQNNVYNVNDMFYNLDEFPEAIIITIIIMSIYTNDIELSLLYFSNSNEQMSSTEVAILADRMQATSINI